MLPSLLGFNVRTSYLTPRFKMATIRVPLKGRGITLVRQIETNERLVFQAGNTVYMHPDTWEEAQRQMGQRIPYNFDKFIRESFLKGDG